MKLNEIIKTLLGAQLQFRICHWQTKAYARHIAFGDIYGTLDGLIDSFVESFMGKYGRFELSKNEKSIEIENLSELDLTLFMKSFKTKLLELNNELSEKDSDLLNIRDEMLFSINKLSYLLTLE